MEQALELFQWVHDKAPSLAGWAVAVVVGWRVYADAAKNKITNKDVLDNYQKLIDAYHVAVVENAKVTERLALLIAERTRARSPR